MEHKGSLHCSLCFCVCFAIFRIKYVDKKYEGMFPDAKMIGKILKKKKTIIEISRYTLGYGVHIS